MFFILFYIIYSIYYIYKIVMCISLIFTYLFVSTGTSVWPKHACSSYRITFNLIYMANLAEKEQNIGMF